MGGSDIVHGNPYLNHHARRHQESKVKSPDEPWFLEKFLSVDGNIMFNYIWVVVSKVYGIFIPVSEMIQFDLRIIIFFQIGWFNFNHPTIFFSNRNTMNHWTFGQRTDIHWSLFQEILGPSEGEDGEACCPIKIGSGTWMTEEMITDNKGSEYVVVNGKVTNFSVTCLKMETSRKELKLGLSEVLQETLQYFWRAFHSCTGCRCRRGWGGLWTKCLRESTFW